MIEFKIFVRIFSMLNLFDYFITKININILKIAYEANPFWYKIFSYNNIYLEIFFKFILTGICFIILWLVFEKSYNSKAFIKINSIKPFYNISLYILIVEYCFLAIWNTAITLTYLVM
jgi:hypothetical protein